MWRGSEETDNHRCPQVTVIYMSHFCLTKQKKTWEFVFGRFFFLDFVLMLPSNQTDVIGKPVSGLDWTI